MSIKDKKLYLNLNLVILLVIAVLIGSYAKPIIESLFTNNYFQNENIVYVFAAYSLSQVFRFLRFQFFLLERDRSTFSLLKLFSFASLASAIFPFKAGDIIRPYLIYRHFKSISLGLVIVIAERFFASQ